jgi:lysophospholipase L1-like esterase
LIGEAIAFAKGAKSNVIAITIPDYAYTPFDQASGNPSTISAEIDRYNAYAKKYCEANSIFIIDISDISRQGLTNKNRVTSDGLDPSELAYPLFVERILTKATIAIHN